MVLPKAGRQMAGQFIRISTGGSAVFHNRDDELATKVRVYDRAPPVLLIRAVTLIIRHRVAATPVCDWTNSREKLWWQRSAAAGRVRTDFGSTP